MVNCLVTGGAGFIGSHIVRALVERGDRVRVLDNFSTGRVENLSGLSDDVEILEGDLRDAARVRQAVDRMEVIFHHAAFISVPGSMEEPGICFEINEKGTLNLLEAARRAGIQRAVLASSAAVYGDSEDLPLKEGTALRPLSPYAASKQMNEVYAGLYTRAFDLPTVVLRYFNVYGPRQRPDSPYAAVIPIFTRHFITGRAPTVFGDGLQRRDFVFVGDVARANLLAASAGWAPGGVFNICTGVEISLLDLLDTLSGILPNSPAPQFAPPRPGDIYRSVGDPSLAAEMLDFRPQVSLAEGLARTVESMLP